MDGYQKCITKQSSKNISDALNHSYVQDGLFIENLKQNKEIGPWEQENNNVFDLFCSELEGSHQFIKYSIHTNQRKKGKKKKTISKNDENVKKYEQAKQNTSLQQYYYTPQIFYSHNQFIDNLGFRSDQDIKIDDQQKISDYKFESKDEQQIFQNNTEQKNQYPTKTLSMVDFPSQNPYAIQQNDQQIEYSNINDNKQNSSFDEKIILRSFKRKSKSQIKQYENINKETQNGKNGYLNSQLSNGNYLNNNSLFFEPDQASKQQIIDQLEQAQVSQVKLLEKKILQKYFDVNVINQQHQVQTLSPKNQFFLRGSVQNAQIKESPSSNAQIGKTERSPIKNQQIIMHYQSEQATQLQQAMINQQVKFKKFKSLRCKQRSISSQSSQIKIPTLVINDSHNDRSPIQIEKHKYQTQEDITSYQNIQIKNKRKMLLKGNGFASNNIELPQHQQQQNKDITKKIVNQPNFLLKNQKQQQQNDDQQQIIQEQQLYLEQEEQIYLPQSARNYPEYDQVYSTVSKLDDHKSRKSSFRQSRKESRDSLNFIGQTKYGNYRTDLDSTRQTPLKNNNYPKINQAENSQNYSESKQNYNSPWSRKNTSKLPQLILSSILNESQNNEDKQQAINTNQAAAQNINSSRIINFPIYDQKPTNRSNNHFNTQQQTKFIQLYFNKSAKKPPIHYQSQLQKHLN